MKVETYTCDQCQRQKKDANHWFRGYRISDEGVLIAKWGAEPRDTQLAAAVPADLCGADCVTQWLSKNLL